MAAFVAAASAHALSAGENEAQWPTKCIGKHMDFAGQSSSGSLQSLVLVPPFRSRPAGGHEPT
jgi:hypothetical protein